MYKYFKELEKKKNYTTYLLRNYFDKNQDIRLKSVPFDEETLYKINKISSKIEFIDKLILSLDEDIFMNDTPQNKYTYEQWLAIGEFFSKKNEYYDRVREGYYSFDNNMLNTYYMLQEISCYGDVLILIFPDHKEFFINLLKEIREIIKHIKNKITIAIPPKEDSVEINWPDSWYITPHGYIYNTGLGHKQGNLVYPLYDDIITKLLSNKKITKYDFSDKIKDIIERGYITDGELYYYSNLNYRLPTIMTKDIEQDILRARVLHEMEREEYERITKEPSFKRPHIERSYQSNLVNLIIGHLDAEMCIYDSFMMLNDCENKSEIIRKIIKMTNGELDEILVRFCGFNKISSVTPKTIITSSTNVIEEFKEYLDSDWTIQIIPRIIYDKYSKELKEISPLSPIIKRHIEQTIENYNGKGKILIYSK